MKLELRKYAVDRARFGEFTEIRDRTLYINRQEMEAHVNREQAFDRVTVQLANPGDSTRIVHIMDVVQPRLKRSGGGGSAYPGAMGAMEVAGSGETNVLDGVAVMMTGKRKGVQEGITDMSGPGSAYCPFATTVNVVLECVPHPENTDIEFDQATRKATLEAAAYLGETTREREPDDVEIFDSSIPEGVGELPRVAYVYHLQSQGVLRETFVYGENVRALLPSILDPNEVLDGAIVSSNYIIACQKNPTYLHANNPVVLELSRRHGKDLVFAGVIIANEHSTLREKQRSSKFAAKLARHLKADGIISTQEGGGHADSDLMLVSKECHRLGIKPVILINEIAGVNGDLPSLVDTTPEADAVVTTGNNDFTITMAPVDTVLGGEDIFGIKGPADAEISIPLGRVYASTNQFGVTRQTVTEY